MTTPAAEFPLLAREALGRSTLQRSLQGVRRAMPDLRARALADLPGGWAAARAEAAAIRQRTLAHLGYHLQEFERQVQAAGGAVHWARTGEEACSIITAICKEAGARRAIKSKSMVTEEISLNEALARAGLRVTETDLGEYIIQLRGERPSHILAPALHVSLAEVGAAFERHHRRERNVRLETPEQMLAEARAELRNVFRNADVGITGANFLVAETGAAVIVTNEGNADLTASLPGTHIVVTGIEKVVPTLDDLGPLLRVLARSAVGEPLSTYTTLVGGPRREGDMSGPRAFHVVLVDNGRSGLIGTGHESILRCIRCSACLNHCPVYTAVGGHAYGSVYSGPMGAALTPALLGLAQSAHLPLASTLCGRCEEVCPVGIPIPALLRAWREQWLALRSGSPWERRILTLWSKVAAYPWAYRMLLAIAARLLRVVSVPAGSSGRRRVRSLVGLLPGWFSVRDLPAPQAMTFQARWRQERGW